MISFKRHQKHTEKEEKIKYRFLFIRFFCDSQSCYVCGRRRKIIPKTTRKVDFNFHFLFQRIKENKARDKNRCL